MLLVVSMERVRDVLVLMRILVASVVVGVGVECWVELEVLEVVVGSGCRFCRMESLVRETVMDRTKQWCQTSLLHKSPRIVFP